MKKIKKIKIKANGKIKSIPNNYKMSDLINKLKIPIKKVAIEHLIVSYFPVKKDAKEAKNTLYPYSDIPDATPTILFSF